MSWQVRRGNHDHENKIIVGHRTLLTYQVSFALPFSFRRLSVRKSSMQEKVRGLLCNDVRRMSPFSTMFSSDSGLLLFGCDLVCLARAQSLETVQS